jgi:hypothetical protein
MIGDPVSVRFAELADRRDYTGATLRPDGTLGLYIRGRGMACGPLSPDQLRAFAHIALGIADAIETQADDAAAMALQELMEIAG